MADIIVVGVLVVLVGAATAYIVRAKKKGVACIGCPSCGSCPHSCAGKGEHMCCGGGKQRKEK